jgi:YHS domain-containing protein
MVAENGCSFDLLPPRSGLNQAERMRQSMKRFLHSLTVAFIVSVVVVAGNDAVSVLDAQTSDPAQNASPKEAKGGTTAKVNVDSQGIILKGCDAVAYFRQGKPVKGNPAIKSTYQGATYLFTSAANKADFDKDPAKYAPQYGAFCSYGVTMGVLADTDGPDAFAVYKGKLYLCGNQGALKEFKNNIGGNIEKADTNWLHLGGL